MSIKHSVCKLTTAFMVEARAITGVAKGTALFDVVIVLYRTQVPVQQMQHVTASICFVVALVATFVTLASVMQEVKA